MKAILTLPLLLIIGLRIIIQLIISIFNNRAFNNAYRQYLQSIEGTKFFCYNNRKTSINFIEQEIIPKLSPEIKIIFVDGRKLQTEYNTQYLSHALYQIKRTAGFPYLLKVMNGTMQDCSMNKELYETINRKGKVDKLIDRINSFYNT